MTRPTHGSGFLSRRVSRFGAAISLALLSGVAWAKGGPPSPPANPQPQPPAQPPAQPVAPAGPGAKYENPEVGLSLEGPAGWRLTATKERVSSWTPLCTYADATTGASAVLSVRRASAITLQKLRTEVTKTYADDKSYTVNSINDLLSGPKRPWPAVIVDASQARAPDPPAPGAPPSTQPSVWRLYAAYYLGGENEYSLVVTARAAVWARVQGLADRMVQGLSLKGQGLPNAARAEGGYQDDRLRFSCKFPGGYGIRVPADQEMSVVEFLPAGDAPMIAIFRYPSEADLDGEAAALVSYYMGDEIGGEAQSAPMEVSGRNGMLVTAKGRVGSRDQVFFVAVVKRDKDTFRLRVSADVTQEQAAKAVFDAFVRTFRLIGP